MHLLLFQNFIYLAFLTAIALCRYDMPCAFFVGANPHTQSTLFACALLADEKVPNYRWAFDKFKICMSGKSPRGIITDQCKAISTFESFPALAFRYWSKGSIEEDGGVPVPNCGGG